LISFEKKEFNGEALEMRKNLTQPLRNKKGMTILEVMVAMVILAFGVLGLAPMIVISMFGNTYSNQVTLADVIAQDRLEEIKTWSEVSPIPFSQTVNNIRGIFTRETLINDRTTDTSIPPGMYKIQINVSWTDQKQLPRSVSYFTYKAKK
jgi:prepilin-type N-terminal cleavage/methylation domain-containing protein